MSKLTLTGTVSFEITSVVDVEQVKEVMEVLRNAVQMDSFKNIPVKNQVMTKLILEAFDKEGIEGAARELIRFNTREIVNGFLQSNMNNKLEEGSVTISPCKMVMQTAEKVLNSAKVRKAFKDVK